MPPVQDRWGWGWGAPALVVFSQLVLDTVETYLTLEPVRYLIVI